MSAMLGSHHPLVKLCRKLHQAKYRRQMGLFLIEGPKLLAEAQRAGVEILHVVTVGEGPNPIGSPAPMTVSETVMAGLATTDSPPTFLAVARIPEPAAPPLAPPLLPVLVGIQDPGNLGAVLRVVGAIGCGMLGLAAGTVDLYNPKVLRSSMGAAFQVRPLFIGNGPAFLTDMRKQGYRIVATAPRGDRVHYYQDFRCPTLLMLGSEGSGLPADWLDEAEDVVTIPCPGGTESLNVAVAAGVILYEALRQREFSGGP